MTLAADYAAGVALDVQALDVLASVWAEGMDAEQLDAVLCAAGVTPAIHDAALTLFDDAGETWEEWGGPVLEWLETALEFVSLWEQPSADMHGTRVGYRVLVSYGGPTTEVVANLSSDWVTVVCRWDGVERVEVFAPHIVATLADLGGALFHG